MSKPEETGNDIRCFFICYYDNIPEGFQSSERGEQMSEAIDNLSASVDSFDSLIEALEEARN